MKSVVCEVVKSVEKVYFLFANFERFIVHPKIVHLPMILDVNEKVRFINSVDACLWGRREGETFGLAIGEFSTKNKPIICMNIGSQGHVEMLGEKALWYKDAASLRQILVSFNPKIEKNKDWNAFKENTPEKVMQIFKKVYFD